MKRPLTLLTALVPLLVPALTLAGLCNAATQTIPFPAALDAAAVVQERIDDICGNEPAYPTMKPRR